MPGLTNAYFLGPGPHASRPAAGPLIEGTMYQCTDHGILERIVAGTWANYTSTGTGNIDGGAPDTVYGGTTPIDGGTP
jgi:hypothetical protein